MVQLQQYNPHDQSKSKVHISVTLAVAVSLVLIVAGIWNAHQTGQIAEENIKTSLQLQRLSDSRAVSASSEFAKHSNDPPFLKSRRVLKGG